MCLIDLLILWDGLQAFCCKCGIKIRSFRNSFRYELSCPVYDHVWSDLFGFGILFSSVLESLPCYFSSISFEGWPCCIQSTGNWAPLSEFNLQVWLLLSWKWMLCFHSRNFVYVWCLEQAWIIRTTTSRSCKKGVQKKNITWKIFCYISFFEDP